VKNPKFFTCGHGICTQCADVMIQREEEHHEEVAMISEIVDEQLFSSLLDEIRLIGDLLSPPPPPPPRSLPFRRMPCWRDFDFVQLPNRAYPAPRNQTCGFCWASAPNGVWIRTRGNRRWHWACNGM
jgi:hypothetical protein